MSIPRERFKDGFFVGAGGIIGCAFGFFLVEQVFKLHNPWVNLILLAGIAITFTWVEVLWKDTGEIKVNFRKMKNGK